MMRKHYLALLFLIVFSATSAQLVLTETLFDPPNGLDGDANRDGVRSTLDDEFIELVNTGASNLDISGYKIYDRDKFDLLPGTDDPRHLIPAGTILSPGGIYVVFGGTDNDDDADLLTIQTAFPGVIFQRASGGRLDLTNASDDMIINDASGTNVISFKPDDLMLNMGLNLSVTRKNSISDPNFVRHTLVEKAMYSPGKEIYFTNTLLVLNEFLMDPGTSDTNGDGTVSNGEDEFLEFVNTSGATLDMSGFKITDQGGYLADAPRHIVPAGTIIPDGGVFLLFGGGAPDGTRGGTISGGDFGGSVFQASSTNTLHLGNSGDAIFVLDASDNVLFSYDSNDAGLLEGDDQSITRNPDITGSFVHHTTTPNGEPNSPGFKIDGARLSTVNKFTATTGTWSTLANWSLGNVPVLTDVVEIPSGNAVTIDTDNTVAKDVVVGGSLTINEGNSLTIDRDLYNIGMFTVESAGSLIVNRDATGNVIYNRNLNAIAGDQNGWHIVASPLIGQTYNNTYANTNNLATSTTDITKRGIGLYNASNDNWSYLINDDSNSGIFDAGTGYSIKRASSGTVSFTGTINTTNVGANKVLTTTGNRYNLLGNPYASYVNSATFLTNEAAISDNKVIWVWDQTLSVNGAYVTKTIGDNFVLAPAQGFFVQANAGGGTFNFVEANQAHNNTDTFLKSSKTEVKLSITDGTIKHYARLVYTDNATVGFDNGYDGELFAGTVNKFAVYTNLVSESQGKNYQVQSLSKKDFDNAVIPLGLNADAGKEITFSTETINLPTGIKVYLEDRENNTFTRIDEANSNYKVLLTNASKGSGRFFIHTSQKALSTNDVTSLEGVSIYKVSNAILKITGIQGNANIKIFNILGKQVFSDSFKSNGNHEITLQKVTIGVYFVKLKTDNEELNMKIILE